MLHSSVWIGLTDEGYAHLSIYIYLYIVCSVIQDGVGSACGSRVHPEAGARIVWVCCTLGFGYAHLLIDIYLYIVCRVIQEATGPARARGKQERA